MDSNSALKLPSPKPSSPLALNELEEDRADHGLGENLQEDFGFAAVDYAFAVDEDAVRLMRATCSAWPRTRRKLFS